MAEHETVTKIVVTRAWTDLEPKVITFLTTGAILSAATYVASLLGFTLPDWAPAVIVWLGSSAAAYLKKSSVPVVAPVGTDGAADVSSLPVVTAPAEPVSTDATYSPDAP